MEDKISIGKTADILGVSIQTMRRWDSKGVLKSQRSKRLAHRYYTLDELEEFLSNNYKYLSDICERWAFDKLPPVIPERFYCQDRAIFKARLSKLETLLIKDSSVGEKFSIITSIVGEIGNNSFDHNLGNWIDARGIVFCFNLEQREIILADRGQGVLATLRRVKKDLSTHKDAIRVAFTEFISGRSPENRGNGLKYVREQVGNYKDIKLYFQTGNAFLNIGDKLELNIGIAENFNRGCFVRIKY